MHAIFAGSSREPCWFLDCALSTVVASKFFAPFCRKCDKRGHGLREYGVCVARTPSGTLLEIPHLHNRNKRLARIFCAAQEAVFMAPRPAGAGRGGRKPPHGRVQTGGFGGRSRRVISHAFCRKTDKLGRARKHPGADSRDDLIRIFIEISELLLLREGGAGIAASLSEDATPTEGSSSGTFEQPQGAAA